jgi:hypothetical protein
LDPSNSLQAGFLKLVVRAADKYLPHISCPPGTPNDLLLLFINDLLVMGNQYFWWASTVKS